MASQTTISKATLGTPGVVSAGSLLRSKLKDATSTPGDLSWGMCHKQDGKESTSAIGLSYYKGHVFMAYRGSGKHDQSIYLGYTDDGANWTGCGHISDWECNNAPALCSFLNRLFIAYRQTGDTHSLKMGVTKDVQGGFQNWTDLGAVVDQEVYDAAPALCVANKAMYLAYVDNNGYIYTKTTRDGKHWTAAVSTGYQSHSGVALATFSTSVYLFYTGTDGSIYYLRKTYGSSNWVRNTISVRKSDSGISAAVCRDRLYIGYSLDSKMYFGSTEDGTNWDDAGVLSDSETTSEYPGIFQLTNDLLCVFPGGSSTIYSQVGTPTQVSDLSSWMQYLDDTQPLMQVSIPGTHDSCSYDDSDTFVDWAINTLPSGLQTICAEDLHLGDPGYYTQKVARAGVMAYTVCQQQTIAEQLSAGIRFLDIRLWNYPGKGLITAHGEIAYTLTFASVLQSCVQFLQAHSTETILMSVKDDGNSTNFASAVSTTISQQSSYFYTNSAAPTIGSIRGKIVLIRRYSASGTDALGLDFSYWPDNTTFTYFNGSFTYAVEDFYLCHRTGSDKWNAILSFLETYQAQYGTWFCICFLSGSNTPFSGQWGAISPTALAAKINPKTFELLQTYDETQRVLGCVIMDRADKAEYLVSSILLFNNI